MPNTARVMAEGLVDDDHVEIIRKAMALVGEAIVGRRAEAR